MARRETYLEDKKAKGGTRLRQQAIRKTTEKEIVAVATSAGLTVQKTREMMATQHAEAIFLEAMHRANLTLDKLLTPLKDALVAEKRVFDTLANEYTYIPDYKTRLLATKIGLDYYTQFTLASANAQDDRGDDKNAPAAHINQFFQSLNITQEDFMRLPPNERIRMLSHNPRVLTYDAVATPVAAK